LEGTFFLTRVAEMRQPGRGWASCHCLETCEIRLIADLSAEEAKKLQMAHALKAQQLRLLGQAEPQFSGDPCDPALLWPKTKLVGPNPKEIRFLRSWVQ